MKRKVFQLAGVFALALLLAVLPAMAGAEETHTIEQKKEEIFFPAVKENPETLFAGFVHSLFYGPARQNRSTNLAGLNLTGNDAILYGELKRSILAIANGDLNSTVITYSPEIFGVEGNYWTAEELGVAEILVDGDINKGLTSEAAQAVRDKFSTNYNDVLEALLRDCSYEMFWYDKTMPMSVKSFNFSVAMQSDGVVRLGWSGVVTVRMPVFEDYAAGQNTVDTAQINRAKTAAANAGKIVNKYKNAADLEKLNGYLREICSLVSYNHNLGGAIFGDPWQMLWVFDGDSETNVVCEGYAKAFQYLCEQTQFASGDIWCFLANGDVVVTGGDLKEHMWNVVRMNDGKNYIVDVTNCDDGAVGSPDLLFLSACAGGSVENGYTYMCHGQEVTYHYNGDTRTMYPASWLEMSSGKYVEPAPWEKLERVTLPADTDEIQASAFEGAGMEMVVLPEGVRVIGDRAFALCGNLRYVYLPESLTGIADTAFDGCQNLTVLCVRGGVADAYAQARGFDRAYPAEEE